MQIAPGCIRAVVSILFCLSFVFANAQQPLSGRIDPPGRTTAPPRIDAAQVEMCLLLARNIANLSDESDRANRANNIGRYNATVQPYNNAINRWNARCAEPYNQADMIRAENKNGFQLCKYTSSPCLSEEERRKILVDDAKR